MNFQFEIVREPTKNNGSFCSEYKTRAIVYWRKQHNETTTNTNWVRISKIWSI